MQMEQRPRKLLDQVRDILRLKHYSIHTEQSYLDWITRFILFHHKRHPRDLGGPEVKASRSVTHLAVDRNVAASTRNLALSALLFLYQNVLEIALDLPPDLVRARRPDRLPAVLTRDEVRRVLLCLPGHHQLLAKLLYGSGLRLIEALRLRVKDLDFSRRTSSSATAKARRTA